MAKRGSSTVMRWGGVLGLVVALVVAGHDLLMAAGPHAAMDVSPARSSTDAGHGSEGSPRDGEAPTDGAPREESCEVGRAVVRRDGGDPPVVLAPAAVGERPFAPSASSGAVASVPPTVSPRTLRALRQVFLI